MCLIGSVIRNGSFNVGKYFEQLMKDKENLRKILEVFVAKGKYKIEFLKTSKPLRDRWSWLIDEKLVTNADFNNSYAEKRIIVDVKDFDDDRGKILT